MEIYGLLSNVRDTGVEEMSVRSNIAFKQPIDNFRDQDMYVYVYVCVYIHVCVQALEKHVHEMVATLAEQSQAVERLGTELQQQREV